MKDTKSRQYRVGIDVDGHRFWMTHANDLGTVMQHAREVRELVGAGDVVIREEWIEENGKTRERILDRWSGSPRRNDDLQRGS